MYRTPSEMNLTPFSAGLLALETEPGTDGSYVLRVRIPHYQR
jgi:hypothetical protein